MVTDVNDKEFKERVEETCIVDFFATWCPPCKMLSPVLEKVSNEYGDKLKFYKINIDENTSIAEEYGVMVVPTLILFKNGNIVNKKSGFMDEKELKEFISQVI